MIDGLRLAGEAGGPRELVVTAARRVVRGSPEELAGAEAGSSSTVLGPLPHRHGCRSWDTMVGAADARDPRRPSPCRHRCTAALTGGEHPVGCGSSASVQAYEARGLEHDREGGSGPGCSLPVPSRARLPALAHLGGKTIAAA